MPRRPGAWARRRPPAAQVQRKGDIADPAASTTSSPRLTAFTPSASVNAGQTWFATTGGGLGGFSTAPGLSGSGRFAFDWIVEKSDAMMVNSGSITTADCSGPTGGDEPRDAADGPHLRRRLVCQAHRSLHRAGPGPGSRDEGPGLPERQCSDRVPESRWRDPGQPWNTAVGGRDQGGGVYGPYLAVTATYQGDVDNNGAVDVVDLLDLAAAWPAESHQPGYQQRGGFQLRQVDRSAGLADVGGQLGQDLSLGTS